jgi:putative Holliday junction resolvase
MTAPARAGAVLAFDFGTKKIGVAVGETTLGVAHPLTTILATSPDTLFAALQRLVDEWQPVQLVVGLPTHADGTPHAMTARARGFARTLTSRFGVPVAMVDERYTTEAADSALVDAGIHGSARKAARDQVAAQLILQAYFDDV